MKNKKMFLVLLFCLIFIVTCSSEKTAVPGDIIGTWGIFTKPENTIVFSDTNTFEFHNGNELRTGHWESEYEKGTLIINCHYDNGGSPIVMGIARMHKDELLAVVYGVGLQTEGNSLCLIRKK